MLYQKAYFLLSAANVKQLPLDQGIEVAIVGRSNAGKSSVLNRITQNKNLARVSKTPGRTQHINVFVLSPDHRIIDLPGYGFAKVPPSAQAAWQKQVDQYIRERQSLKGLVLVMDARHPMKPLDCKLLEFCASRELAVHILLNKADKLNKNESNLLLMEIKKALSQYNNAISYQLFSALKGMGIKTLHQRLNEWYHERLT